MTGTTRASSPTPPATPRIPSRCRFKVSRQRGLVMGWGGGGSRDSSCLTLRAVLCVTSAFLVFSFLFVCCLLLLLFWGEVGGSRDGSCLTLRAVLCEDDESV